MVSSDAEKTKGRRVQRLIYLIMAVFILLPLVLFCILR
jgi:hypothetical protein